jgi:DNA topoisomerase-2
MTKNTKNEPTIEEKYQKLTQIEHVKKRPGMYIGNIKNITEEQWIFDYIEKKMIKKFVNYTPAFLKIFDEVLTNATDHASRDSTCTSIKVDFDKKTGEISVWNNGSGIPVVIHKEHNIYVPELIFGHLLSGSNYNDNDTRIGAGLNGLGVKLVNLFSKNFTIETIDSDNSLKYIQEFTDGLENKSKPKVTKNSGKSYTKISFIPDFKAFSMKKLDEDTISLLSKRVYDCIACTNKNVSIFLNGEKLKGKGLVDYAKYFFDEESNDTPFFADSIIQKIGKNDFIWEYVIVPYSQFEQVSFVNGNSTYNGGKHVDHIMYQIVNKLKTLLETKKKLKDIKPAMIRERMFLFLRATIANPQFNSQTKEYLTTQVKDFGCKIDINDKFIDKIWKSQIIEDIVQYHKLKETMDIAKKTDGSKKSKVYIPKLEDALWAGTSRSDQCTLILTEGDSAKTFAMWGRSVIGPEKYAVFPLRGKLLNFRDATAQQLVNNEEINNIKQILGLKQGKEYKDTSDLRYGKVMVLTDADVDGSHIKSLFVNFIHAQWPSLIKLNFIQTLRTPIVKAIKGKNVIEFYTEQDYNKWKETTNLNNFQIKYFKGLGTSRKEDAQNSFKNLDSFLVDYYYKDKNCDESILLAFEKDKNIKPKKIDDTDSIKSGNIETVNTNIKCTDKRKLWLGTYDKNTYIDSKQKKISYQDLINKELIHFSIYDNLRSIPSLCDGLKPSQRKILHYMLKKDITKDIKVAQLSGYVSAETSYHHGEASLQQAIVGMAQDFVSTNNINLLYPNGNFGSRYGGGKDSASPRYIFTKLSNVTKSIFHKDDTKLLNYLNDDGELIEPEWFVPIIPMILVNGCEGIGTGYSTYIPPYNPKDIVTNLNRIMDDKEPLEMDPYFKGFNGILEKTGENSYITKGKWERMSDCQIKITELPVGMWVTQYKEFLESLIPNSNTKTKTEKKPNNRVQLKDVQNKTIDENNNIILIVEFKNADDLDKLIKQKTLEKELKLVKSFSTNNMYVFDDKLIPTKYNSPQDILLDFYDIRLEFYIKRKEYLTKKLKTELEILQSKVRFIEEYIDKTLDINKKSKDVIISMLEERGYKKFGVEDINNINVEFDEKENTKKSFDYLIKMPIYSLCLEKIEELTKQTQNKKNELDILKSKTEKDLWREDLSQINKQLI